MRLDRVFACFLVARGLAEDLLDDFGGFLARRSGDAFDFRFHFVRLGVNFDCWLPLIFEKLIRRICVLPAAFLFYVLD